MREIYRADLHSFGVAAFDILNPGTTWMSNWHTVLLAAKLQECVEGLCQRLIITLPRRHLKSHFASIVLPAFILGHNPAAGIICVSYAQDLSDKLARDCRNLMQSSLYQDIFPTRISSEKSSVSEFETTGRGYRLATSIGGVLTGRGADFLVIDDPMKPSDASSEIRRRSVTEWFDGTLLSRLNSKDSGCIIIVMQRVHEEDLVGHVVGRDGDR